MTTTAVRPAVLIPWLAPAAMALTLSLWAWTQALFGVAFLIGAVGLMLTWMVSGASIGPRWAFAGILVLLASVVVAVMTARGGFGNEGAAFLAALWVAIMAGTYLVNHSPRVLACLVPAGLALALLLTWQGVSAILAGSPERVPGGPMGPNPAAGFLAIIAAALLPTRWRWLALPLLVGIVFTASRSGLLAVGVAALAVAVMHRPSWKVVAGGAAVGLLVLALAWPFVGGMLLRNDTGYSAREYFVADLRNRFSVPSDESGKALLPSFVPRGPAGPFLGLHNVPLRMAYEQGILAVVVWIALTGWALWRSPRGTPAWTALVAFSVVAMFDYYPMMPLVTSAFWPTLLSIRLKEEREAQ